jgi:hypothetical protein
MSSKAMSMYVPSSTFTRMVGECLLWGTLGLILGVMNNNMIVVITNKLNVESLLLQNTLQLVFCSILLSAIHVNYNYFGWSWQNLTPGLFFVSFFFGVQFKMITNIQNSYIVEDTVKKLLEKPF